MKLTFNIDNEVLGAMLTLLDAKPDEKKTIRDYIDSHDTIEVPGDLLDKAKNGKDLMMAMSLIALGCAANELEKKL